MAPHRLSYLKTLVGAVGLTAVGFAVMYLAAVTSSGPIRNLVVLIGSSVSLIGAGLAIGVTLALYRDRLQAGSQKDLFNVLNMSRSQEALTASHPGFGILLRRVWRHILRRPGLLVGDVVQIRTLEEIQSTLDESGCLDGLPFMEEMRVNALWSTDVSTRSTTTARAGSCGACRTRSCWSGCDVTVALMAGVRRPAICCGRRPG
jgi:hypothetical protein